MCPALAGVCIGDNNLLARESERPYLRRMRVIDAGLNRGRPLEARRCIGERVRLGKVIIDPRITFHTRDVGTRR